MPAIAASVNHQFELMLILAHETEHRGNSIRLLRWSDVDIKLELVRWRAETDKIGFEHVTPLTATAVTALTTYQQRCNGRGGEWIFPSERFPVRPTTRVADAKWWEKAETLAKITRVHGRGWHSVRRQFASEVKHTPLRDLAYLGGWKNPQTILLCYQMPDRDLQR